ncbi:hypothetical protein LIER_32234 [Lithospermum erythrorhizon]|uniref:RNase H type-1 domain-containing protein n=1 Tax=Lithospermum erythrorhizon TaxID=34254 RepID=A0AAV3RZ70_LITER
MSCVDVSRQGHRVPGSLSIHFWFPFLLRVHTAHSQIWKRLMAIRERAEEHLHGKLGRGTCNFWVVGLSQGQWAEIHQLQVVSGVDDIPIWKLSNNGEFSFKGAYDEIQGSRSELIHVWREQNQAADWVAKTALADRQTFFWRPGEVDGRLERCAIWRAGVSPVSEAQEVFLCCSYFLFLMYYFRLAYVSAAEP